MELGMVGLGKMGGRELNFGSDLDLVFVYGEDGETDKGQGNLQDLDHLLAIAGDMEGNTICVFADAAAWPVESYITKFRGEFEEYIRSGRRSKKNEAVVHA